MMLRLTMMHIHSYSAQVPHGPTSTRTPLRSNPTSTRIRSAQLSSGEFCATGAFKPLEGLSQGGLMAHCHIPEPASNDARQRLRPMGRKMCPKRVPENGAQSCARKCARSCARTFK